MKSRGIRHKNRPYPIGTRVEVSKYYFSKPGRRFPMRGRGVKAMPVHICGYRAATPSDIAESVGPCFAYGKAFITGYAHRAMSDYSVSYEDYGYYADFKLAPVVLIRFKETGPEYIARLEDLKEIKE